MQDSQPPSRSAFLSIHSVAKAVGRLGIVVKLRKKLPPAFASQEEDPNDTKSTHKSGYVVIHNEFYRDGYPSLLHISILEALIIFGLIANMLFVIEAHQPENRYFPTTEDGRLVPMVALSEPNLSIPTLLSWAAQASTEVMTFGYHDYKRRLQEASRNFTRTGWASFTSSLEKSRIIEIIESNRQVVAASPSSAPVLVEEGLVDGRYQWNIKIPMAIKYRSGVTFTQYQLQINLIVVRVPKLESPNGVGIEQWSTSSVSK